MKILILSCNTGGGHNSAAIAIRDTLVDAGHDCTFLDLFSIGSQKLSGRVSKAYLFSTKLSFLFRFCYWAGGKITRAGRRSPVYAANSLHADRLYQYLQANPCDVILMTHLFPAEQLTCLKHRGQLSIPTIAIGTDYTCIPFWEETDVDYYVLPHGDLAPEFVQRGMNPQTFLPFGIPVSPKVKQREEKLQARQRLAAGLLPGLEPEKPLLLIMSGSMGFGSSRQLVGELLQSGVDAEMCVVCGSNKKQEKRLRRRFKENERVHILGYTQQVPLLLHSADVVFTKPGGLTTTEVAVSRTPLVHTAPIPGCENANAAFFASRGMSVSAKEPEEQCRAGIHLLQDRDAAHRMRENQEKYIPGDANEKLLAFLESHFAKS